MNILILTQVVDTQHPILGFFHRWIVEFSLHYEHVYVICLEAGTYDLPSNVTVYSLGKEQNVGRLKYLYRFFTTIWHLRSKTVHVFVHMNQIYIILGALLWRWWGMRVGLWYTHGTVSRSLRMAEKLTHYIFTASVEGCQLVSEKIVITGHGIDTVTFSPQIIPKNIDLITVGRITRSKNLHTLINAVRDLQPLTQSSLTIVGVAITASEKSYLNQLHEQIKAYKLTDQIHFIGAVSQIDLPNVLQQSRIFVTMAQNGSLDKAILESMAVGLPIVSTAPGSKSVPLGTAQVTNQADFVAHVCRIYSLNTGSNIEYQQYVKKEHSLSSLIPKIVSVYGGELESKKVNF